jgi:GT2 family glycosyltransferase
MTKTNDPLVSIIILNYNAGTLLLDCIESILHTNYKNYEIIVVDNLSSDASHKKCKEKFNQIILIENDKNLGYCEGNNVGARIAKGKFIVILNPDTIVEPKWLDELMSAYNIHGEGLYQPKFLATTDHMMLLSTGQMIQLFGFGFSRGKGIIDNKQYENFEKVGYASGTCLFTSLVLFKNLGMFDSFLFAYHDDLDLGWRAVMNGIKSYYVPDSIVYHPVEGYIFKWSHFKFYLMEKNRNYCILTHYSHSTLLKMIPALILVNVGVFFFYLKKNMIKEKIRADLNILKNLSLINKKYHELQNKRTVTDRIVVENFVDEILVPEWVLGKDTNSSFNKLLKKVSRITRKFI